MKKIDSTLVTPALPAATPALSADKAARKAQTETAPLPQGIGAGKQRQGTRTTEMVGTRRASLLAAAAGKAISTEKLSHDSGSAIGSSPEGMNASSAMSKGIIGRGDRAHHLALNPVLSSPQLPPPKVGPTTALPSVTKTSSPATLKPRSRFECEGRCGANGFCDPLNERGCGGIYCGRRRDKVV